MITTGIVQEVGITASDSSLKNNLYRVGLPIFTTAADTSEYYSTLCTACLPGGLHNSYNTGDLVYVSFVNNQLADGVILGKIYKGANEDIARSYAHLDSLKVDGSTRLSLDTKLGDFDLSNVITNTQNIANLDSLTSVLSVRSDGKYLSQDENGTLVWKDIDFPTDRGNVTFRQDKAPDPKETILIEGDLWFNTSLESTEQYVTGSWYQWNGSAWVPAKDVEYASRIKQNADSIDLEVAEREKSDGEFRTNIGSLEVTSKKISSTVGIMRDGIYQSDVEPTAREAALGYFWLCTKTITDPKTGAVIYKGNTWYICKNTGTEETPKYEWIEATAEDNIPTSAYQNASYIKQTAEEISTKVEGKSTTYYGGDIPPEAATNADLWYCTKDLTYGGTNYYKDTWYRYDKTAATKWVKTTVNCKTYYSDKTPSENINVGDLWYCTGGTLIKYEQGTVPDATSDPAPAVGDYWYCTKTIETTNNATYTADTYYKCTKVEEQAGKKTYTWEKVDAPTYIRNKLYVCTQVTPNIIWALAEDTSTKKAIYSYINQTATGITSTVTDVSNRVSVVDQKADSIKTEVGVLSEGITYGGDTVPATEDGTYWYVDDNAASKTSYEKGWYKKVNNVWEKITNPEDYPTTYRQSSKIIQTSTSISQIVTDVGKDGKVTAASIVTSINDDGTSGIKLNADKLTFEGQDIKIKGTNLDLEAGGGAVTISSFNADTKKSIIKETIFEFSLGKDTTTAPTTGWSTTRPTPTTELPYTWQRTVSVFIDDTSGSPHRSASNAVCLNGLNGKDASSGYTLSLSNDYSSVPTYKDGSFPSAFTTSTELSVWYGATKQKIVKSGSAEDEWIVTTKCDPSASITAAVDTSDPAKYTITAATTWATDTATVIFTAKNCKDTSKTVEKTFNLAKLRQGEPGTALTRYYLLCNLNTINKTKSGAYTDSKIEFTAYKQTGDSGPTGLTKDYKWMYTVDSGTQTTVLAQALSLTFGTGSGQISPSKSVYTELYVSSDSGKTYSLVDKETVSVVCDGVDGAEGLSILSTTNLYKLHNSSTSGPKAPTSPTQRDGWQIEVPSWKATDTNKYLWRCVETNFGYKSAPEKITATTYTPPWYDQTTTEAVLGVAELKVETGLIKGSVTKAANITISSLTPSTAVIGDVWFNSSNGILKWFKYENTSSRTDAWTELAVQPKTTYSENAPASTSAKKNDLWINSKTSEMYIYGETAAGESGWILIEKSSDSVYFVKQSVMEQTADKINWVVANGSSASSLTMTDKAITAATSKLKLTIGDETPTGNSCQILDGPSVVGAKFGFTLDSDGWYKSTNKGKIGVTDDQTNQFTAALAYAKLTINVVPASVEFLINSFGEVNSDFGLVSKAIKTSSTFTEPTSDTPILATTFNQTDFGYNQGGSTGNKYTYYPESNAASYTGATRTLKATLDNVLYDFCDSSSKLYISEYKKTESITTRKISSYSKITHYPNSGSASDYQTITYNFTESGTYYICFKYTKDFRKSLNEDIFKFRLNSLTDSNNSKISISLGNGESVITSGDIKLNGKVTFQDLAGTGTTIINGANIKTGTLSADTITTGTLSADRIRGGTITGISMSLAEGKFTVDSSGNVKITAEELHITDDSDLDTYITPLKIETTQLVCDHAKVDEFIKIGPFEIGCERSKSVTSTHYIKVDVTPDEGKKRYLISGKSYSNKDYSTLKNIPIDWTLDVELTFWHESAESHISRIASLHWAKDTAQSDDCYISANPFYYGSVTGAGELGPKIIENSAEGYIEAKSFLYSKNLPPCTEIDAGTYTLACTVDASGNKTYSWAKYIPPEVKNQL